MIIGSNWLRHNFSNLLFKRGKIFLKIKDVLKFRSFGQLKDRNNFTLVTHNSNKIIEKGIFVVFLNPLFDVKLLKNSYQCTVCKRKEDVSEVFKKVSMKRQTLKIRFTTWISSKNKFE